MIERSFNIRVYGLCTNDNNEVLLSDEYVLDTKMTKFPGGGLEFGEGPEDCLKREAFEEFGQEIIIKDHFYTTHYYQPALYFENTQLISIYYLFDFAGPIQFKLSNHPFDFEKMVNGSQSFRWKNITELTPEELNFPIDRYALKLLKEKLHL